MQYPGLLGWLVAGQNTKVHPTLFSYQVDERLNVWRHRALLRSRFTDISHKLDMLHLGL